MSPKKGQCAAQAMLLLPNPFGINSFFFQSVILRMRDDDVSRIVRNDSLILRHGERLFSRTDIEERSGGHISGRLRELGWLYITSTKLECKCQHYSRELILLTLIS